MDIDFLDAMTVNVWFEYWIGIKKRTVRPNTVRNYTERYHRNIEPIIGNKMLGSVNTIHCQTRIALFNMLDTLQTILGHSNIGITMNLYVHTTEE